MTASSLEDPHQPASCSTCYKPIHPRAKKCTECDSFQDWRRYLSISSSILALLVALVSVVALAAPALIAMLTPKTAQIELAQQGAVNNQLFVLATNSGIRPGSITSAYMGFSDFFDDSKNTDTDLIAMPVEPLIILPGQALRLVVEISPEARQEIDKRYWALYDAKVES